MKEIGILADENQLALLGVFPNFGVLRRGEINAEHVLTIDAALNKEAY
jgi:hypothetical protein